MDFTKELQKLEKLERKVFSLKPHWPKKVNNFQINPTLEIFLSNWKFSQSRTNPKKQKEWLLVWKKQGDVSIQAKPASKEELLALKMVAENISLEQAAQQGNISVKALELNLKRAAKKGIILKPTPKLKRNTRIFKNTKNIDQKFIISDTFTLQWHITNVCDLHCKHCYDRTRRSPFTLEQGYKVLDGLERFTRTNRVRGHVCFSGGNPFLSPHFFKLYKRAEQKGFSTSILGNPVSREDLKKVIEIQKPGYYQVSLEGLPEHNDYIRGKNNFSAVIKFLKILRELKISSAVMLTLTKENMSQILPLAKKLRGHAEYFTFNRLSQTGEGEGLGLPKKEDYQRFLEEYIKASETNPIIGFKDNLINIVLERENDKLFSGCTGFGCGAAFNFVAVLADGEVHACRKFPSLIGNILKQSLQEIYDSKMAKRYRRGAKECDGCSLRHACGGCLAVTSGCKKDILKDKDPYCFK
ncbi:MAG: thio(seleno)oxazole modification radical SAM maturase SbtM [Candidatus Aceula meridiana]|nr:thio(seleno)oxazole modification radical SAM maturase SbtM [Candidatus Aceula meridiana]